MKTILTMLLAVVTFEFILASSGDEALGSVLLLLSLRKHTRRVDFNDAGQSDAERMGLSDDADGLGPTSR